MCVVDAGIEHKALADYARYVLKEICRQEWVREKFLKKPEYLLSHDLLLDRTLSHKQVRVRSHTNRCVPALTQTGACLLSYKQVRARSHTNRCRRSSWFT